MSTEQHYFGKSSDCPMGDSRLRKKLDWDIVAEINAKTAEGSQLTKLIESCQKLDLKGQVLVDGNHAFLHALRFSRKASTEWGRLAKAFPGSKLEALFTNSSCPFSWDSARVLSYISAQIMHRAMDKAVECAAPKYVESGTRIIASDAAVAEEPEWLTSNLTPDTDTLLHCDWEIIAFDGPMPDIQGVLNTLFEYEQHRRSSNNRYELLFERIKAGRFVHDFGGERFDVPYDLKNEYIEDLSNNHFAESYFGYKKLILNESTAYLKFKEKQVDVLLTMALCDAAERSDLDWVCVLTNDGDFVPAIERVLKSGKRVIWVTAETRRKRSRDLLNCVGPENSFTVDDLFSTSMPNVSPWLWELFGRPGMFATIEYPSEELYNQACEDGTALLPWTTSVHEIMAEINQG